MRSKGIDEMIACRGGYLISQAAPMTFTAAVSTRTVNNMYNVCLLLSVKTEWRKINPTRSNRHLGRAELGDAVVKHNASL